ncbi:hypothetical protein N7535_004902 [Penicillium sp. DV-2018c]|nr:hypothetical protein N7461_008484 [Penicillium sp. DV-2018c]KAJ5571242.1 hypothetical protein N7535_004902 [Penicillium sp. DV-2018c]
MVRSVKAEAEDLIFADMANGADNQSTSSPCTGECRSLEYCLSVMTTASSVTLTDDQMEDDEEADKENKPTDLEQQPIITYEDEAGEDPDERSNGLEQ